MMKIDPLNSWQFGDDIIYSGESDESMVQKYYQWRSHTQIAVCNTSNCPPSPLVDMWSTPADSRVPIATMGRQFARSVAHGSCVNTFVPQTFRQFTLCNKNSEEVVVKGVTLLRFTLVNETYQNADEFPDNARWRQTGPSGLANVGKAQHGMPVFMSKPHFYGAPLSTWAHLDGDIQPNYELHGIVFFDHRCHVGLSHASDRVSPSPYNVYCHCIDRYICACPIRFRYYNGWS
jgi:hypothetical protein